MLEGEDWKTAVIPLCYVDSVVQALEFKTPNLCCKYRKASLDLS